MLARDITWQDALMLMSVATGNQQMQSRVAAAERAINMKQKPAQKSGEND